MGLIAVAVLALTGCGGSPAGKGQEPAQQPPGVAVCMGGANSGQGCPNGNLDGVECGVDGLCVAAGSCIGGPNDGQPCPLGTECGDGVCPDVRLQADEVRAIIEAAGRALDPGQYEVAVAVTDRRGVVLGVGTNFPIDYDGACDTSECPGAGFTPGSDPFTVDTALQLARTAAFFSADQTPLTSRSVRYISGEHFPPGVQNTGAAALFGIENTNRGCSFDAVTQPLAASIPRADNLCSVLASAAGLEPIPCRSGGEAGDQCGCTRGILTLPGAVPIYRIQGGAGRMAGGIGVFVRHVVPEPDRVAAYPPGSGILRYEDDQSAFALAEFAARAYAGDRVGLPNVAARGLTPICDPASNVAPPACCGQTPACDFNILAVRNPPFDPVIFIDGIEVPEVANNPPVGAGAGSFGRCSGSLEPCRVGGPACPLGESCAAITQYIVAPNDLAQPVPQGWLVSPTAASPGAAPVSAGEVADIIDSGAAEAGRIRAGIRLPLAVRTEMMLAVSDTRNAMLGLFRMQDATVFSIDVAIAKSRNVTYFSSPAVDPLDTMDCPGPADPPNALGDCRGPAFGAGTAVTNRTLSFGAQPFFPSGIEGQLRGFPYPFAPGPFRQTFIYDSNHPCTNGLEPSDGRQNGIVFFPGATPIYRAAALIGGFGVSGDGVEQDDLVTVAGARADTGGQGFLPDARLRADRVFVRNVRLPFVKFNRRPEQ
ncbi:MAG: heme-binding protein [Candidatus Binatia bacterium]